MSAAENASAEDFVRAMLARPPFHQWLRPDLVELDEDRGTLTIQMPYRPELSRSPDRQDYHGGILAALIDIAGHACVAAKLRRRVPTIDMRIDFLRPAVDTDLSAIAEIRRLGRTVGACDVQIFDEASRVLALGRCLYSTHQE